MWQLISSQTFGERTVEVYSMAVSGGVLYKNVTTYTDAVTKLVKTVSESMAFSFVSSGGGGGGGGPIGTALSQFNQVTAVPMGVTTPLLMFTAPLIGQTYMYRIDVSGTNAATYRIYRNGNQIEELLTSIAGPFGATADFTAGNSAGILLAPGDTIEVDVVHSRPMAGDFNARIQYVVA